MIISLFKATWANIDTVCTSNTGDDDGQQFRIQQFAKIL